GIVDGDRKLIDDARVVCDTPRVAAQRLDQRFAPVSSDGFVRQDLVRRLRLRGEARERGEARQNETKRARATRGGRKLHVFLPVPGVACCAWPYGSRRAALPPGSDPHSQGDKELSRMDGEPKGRRR